MGAGMPNGVEPKRLVTQQPFPASPVKEPRNEPWLSIIQTTFFHPGN